MGLYGGGRSTEHIASPCRNSCFAFERLTEGDEEFPPRLQCLIFGELAAPLGRIVGKGVGLDEGGCGDGHKEIVQEGEADAYRLLLGVLERVEVLWDTGVPLP